MSLKLFSNKKNQNQLAIFKADVSS